VNARARNAFEDGEHERVENFGKELLTFEIFLVDSVGHGRDSSGLEGRGKIRVGNDGDEGAFKNW
jgi:hypothetical protein